MATWSRRGWRCGIRWCAVSSSALVPVWFSFVISAPSPKVQIGAIAHRLSRGLEYRDDAAGEAVFDIFDPGEAAVEAAKGKLFADLVFADRPVGRRIGQHQIGGDRDLPEPGQHEAGNGTALVVFGEYQPDVNRAGRRRRARRRHPARIGGGKLGLHKAGNRSSSSRVITTPGPASAETSPMRAADISNPPAWGWKR